MKFSEFVGEADLLKKLKKRVDTPLGKTEEDFYNIVARRDKPYTVETSIGYGLSKNYLKRTFDYIKSWLIRYNIKYEAVNPYLTLANVEGEYKRDKFIKALKRIRESHIFKPSGVFILRDGETDFIIIDYIFSLDVESFPLELFDQMVFSLPDLPKVRPGNVGLLVRRK